MPEPRPDEEERDEPAPKRPAPPKRKAPIVALVGLAVVLAIVIVPWLFRSTIATSMVGGQLAAEGVSCDERFAVDVAAFFGSATIQPTRCTIAEGHVEAIEITTPAEVDLSGLDPSAIRADHVRLTLRSRDLAGGTGWASELRRLNLEQRVAGLVKGLAELSKLGLPETTIARVEVTRGADHMADLAGVTLTPGGRLGVGLQQVVFTAVMGAAQLTLTGVTGTATSDAVHLEGNAAARAGLAIFSFSREGTFTLDATHLETTPRFHLESTLN